MSVRFNIPTALLVSAVFVFSTGAFAQAPIVDASVDSHSGGNSADQPAAAQDNGGANAGASDSSQGELFYQLQLLQQEVMKLRGQVEDQAHQLQQLKEQNMERYIDLDRRIGNLTQQGVPAAAANPAPATAATVQGGAANTTASPAEKKAYDRAYSLVLNKQFSDALDAFKQYLVDYPGGKYAPNSYYWMGELYQVITPADLEAARQAFSQLLKQYPDHPKAADAMYKLGKVYFLLGNKTASREWLHKVIDKYSSGSNSSAADKARQFLNANF